MKKYTAETIKFIFALRREEYLSIYIYYSSIIYNTNVYIIHLILYKLVYK